MQSGSMFFKINGPDWLPGIGVHNLASSMWVLLNMVKPAFRTFSMADTAS